MIATEKIGCYSQFLREGSILHNTGLHVEAPGLVRGRKEKGEKQVQWKLLFGFHRKGQVRSDKHLSRIGTGCSE